MICLPLPISEYLIYKYPEEAHLPASVVIQKRREEYMKSLEFFHKILYQEIVPNNNNRRNK